MDKRAKTILVCVFCAGFLGGFYHPLFAYVMSSGNYKIESDDSLTPTGGLGTSANYIFRDTMGEVSSGGSNSALYKLKAGFQEMQETSLSVTSPGDQALSPDIPGISGGTATANTNWTVNADNSAGFDMKMAASTNPALKLDGSYYFDNYSSTPTKGWTVSPNTADFGFAVVPAEAGEALAFQDNGSSCGAGTNTGNCWAGFDGTNQTTIVHRTTRTDPAGEVDGINFKAESKGFLKDGSYVASITVTVVSN